MDSNHDWAGPSTAIGGGIMLAIAPLIDDLTKVVGLMALLVGTASSFLSMAMKLIDWWDGRKIRRLPPSPNAISLSPRIFVPEAPESLP